MAKKRSDSKWENQFKISQKIFELISELGTYNNGPLNDNELIRDACVAFRNPVVFDNQVSDAVFELYDVSYLIKVLFLLCSNKSGFDVNKISNSFQTLSFVN